LVIGVAWRNEDNTTLSRTFDKGLGMTAIESKVVQAWRQAADDLGIRFSSPFVVTRPDGSSFECIGFIHHFGRRLGTIISVIGEPSSNVKLSADEDYFSSQLSPGYCAYKRQSFINTLDDWAFFGPDAERPAWYTGKYWGQE
jgi:hypothetical protein